MHYEAKAAHLGGNLSCLDILMTLYHDVLKPEDVFILSKGHSAGALYVTLWSKGLLSDDDLKTFHGEGTSLPGHAPLGGGSLGHGLSIAAGVALGKKLQGQPGRVYCLCSDGEMQEGSVWEAARMAGDRGLVNLKLIVDANGWGGLGRVRSDTSMEMLSACRWVTWRYGVGFTGAGDVDVLAAIGGLQGDAPTALLSTALGYHAKGLGVSFLQDRLESHYAVLTHDQYEQAMKELV